MGGLVLDSFEKPEDLSKVEVEHARVSLVREHATEGLQALRIEFEPAEKPTAIFPAGGKPWDWREQGALALDLTNPSHEDIPFAVRIDDDIAADGVNHSRTGRAIARAGETQSLALPFGASAPMEHGMRGGPPVPGVEPMRFVSGSTLETGHITAFQIFLSRPSGLRTLIVDNIRLLPPPSYDHIVDQFGQYTRADWARKLKDGADLARHRKAEEAEIHTAPKLPDRDPYGGWASGPSLESTGFFRTVRRGGQWWLLTPSGHLFFSLGIDVIETQEGYTITEGRENMFTWLPGPEDQISKHFGYTRQILYGPIKQGRTFNFYTANLERKYGPGFLEKWFATALDRLGAWGFNTIGNWSDPKLYAMKRVPYVATVDIEGDFARVPSGADYWGKMTDPFDSEFAAAADRSIRRSAQRTRGDHLCLGTFVDNELSWGNLDSDRSHFGLAYGALSGPKDLPAKKAFIRQLQQRYARIGRLNSAWRTKFSSWQAMLDKPFEPKSALNLSMRKDFALFLKDFARQYFKVVRDALKRYDPNHLYLGCRFAWHTPEAVEASAEYCDVVSFNIYERRLDPKKWNFVSVLKKPCIIGEFHFGAMDRGMFHPGLVAAANQQARAEMYRDYVNSVADNPSFVGCHWFQYFDEPLTGRALDGENYNMGFVSVTDTPYPEMVSAAKAVHSGVYARRLARVARSR